MSTSKGFQQSVYLLATEPANLATVTVAEIGAGTALHAGLPNPVSFAGTTNQVEVSVIGSRQDLFEPGTLTPQAIAIEPRRNTAGAAVVAAVTADNDYWLVKFEGGNIAAGDHGAVAAGDTYDAVQVVAGSRSDVDTPRPDARGTRIEFQIADTIQWGGIVAA
jgi:hypothetical protein